MIDQNEIETIGTIIEEAKALDVPAEIVEEEQKKGAYPLTNYMKRQLLIRRQDLETRYPQYAKAQQMTEYFVELGKITAMEHGTIPFEDRPEFNGVSVVKPQQGEIIKHADFFVDGLTTDTRLFKEFLEACFRIRHKPHASTRSATGRPDYIKDHPTWLRFKIWNVTNTECTQFLEMAKANNFTIVAWDLYAWKERDVVGPQAEIVLPQSNAQKAAAKKPKKTADDIDELLK